MKIRLSSLAAPVLAAVLLLSLTVMGVLFPSHAQVPPASVASATVNQAIVPMYRCDVYLDPSLAADQEDFVDYHAFRDGDAGMVFDVPLKGGTLSIRYDPTTCKFESFSSPSATNITYVNDVLLTPMAHDEHTRCASYRHPLLGNEPNVFCHVLDM